MTVTQIAKKAGVSIATVSRVLNNKENVNEQTRKLVMDIVLEDGNEDSLSLANPNSKTILMCVPSLTNPFNDQVIKGVLDSAASHCYKAFFYCVSEFNNNFASYAKTFTSGSFSGLIIQSPIQDTAFLQDLSLRFPLVMCSEYAELDNVSFVAVDNKSAAKKAVNYLLSIGRKKIALMNTVTDRLHSKFRELGYREALQNAGINVREDWITHISSVDYSLAIPYARDLLNQEDRPDAVFAISDVFAAAVINVAKKLKLRVPQDISVVGFDDIDIAKISTPAISTIRQPAYDIGYQSCELLISKIEGKTPAKKLVLDTELIIRESTC